jgi:hypothetical protein
MIKQNDIKELVDGKKDGQIVTAIVQAGAEIVPTVVLNVYCNLKMKFMWLQQTVLPPETNIVSDVSGKVHGKPAVLYFFNCSKKDYEKLFGDYHPSKILPFAMEFKKHD